MNQSKPEKQVRKSAFNANEEISEPGLKGEIETARPVNMS